MNNLETKFELLKQEVAIVEKTVSEQQARQAELQKMLATISMGLHFQRQGATRREPVWFTAGQN